MIPFVELVWRLVASVLRTMLGTVVSTDPAGVIALAGAAGAIGLFAIVAASVVRSTLAAAAAATSDGASVGTLLEPADRAELLSQSDPDADGRARPRAPGFVLPTA